MTCHPTLLLAYFSAIFFIQVKVVLELYQKKKVVLEQLPMVFRTFCNVFISGQVILVFPKPNSCSLFFFCNSKQDHVNAKKSIL